MSNFYWFFLFLNQAAVVVMWTRCEIDSIFSADWRVRPLVLYIKKWARFHDINDASKATISSYSLCLMLIHYLQCMSSLSFNTCTSWCLCGEFSHVLSFLTMYMSVVMMYMYICKFSADQIICYFNLHVADPILVVIIVFPFICRCLLPTGTSLLTGALPCESIKSVVNVIHVHLQFL